MADQFLKDLEDSGLREPSEMRPLVIKWIEERFPGVESIPTQTLQQWMEDKPGELLLLDTRSPAEFEVSHLPEAILVPPETDAVKEIFKAWFQQENEGYHRHIVCYCTVGYRSSMTAQLLRDYLCCETNQHFITSSMIYNLQGGLVKWASEKRWMVDQYNKPSSKMHPYNEVWAKLLEPEFKVETKGNI
ncbi:adenylyltransferase and sulfurtransferase MOCS3-like [Thamnophis elegans]|uniref:adenylyltransferase and sulfurtransferase MOCS3-like n=1 Tax=Thamnophis elegans TaxID=35005 RepID=UPI001377FA55|nr:adenylyltransferase and sulfurtransferase MOCS3-like [Thamnophis elegans]